MVGVVSYLPEVDDDGVVGVVSYLPEVDDDGVVVFYLTFQKWMMTGWLGLYSPLYMVFCFQSLTSTSCRPHMSSSSSFSSKICSRFCGTRALNPFISAFIWSSTRDTKRHLITRLHTHEQMVYLTIHSIHFIDVYMVSDIVIIIYLKLCFI